MKKRNTRYHVLFSSKNKSHAEKYFDNLKDTSDVTIYSRTFKGKDKTRYYVRKVVRTGRKFNG